METPTESASRIAGQAEAPPARQEVYWQQALFWHGLGFVTLVIVLWADRLFQIGQHLGVTEENTESYLEVSAKSGVVVLLWMLSAYKVYLVVRRLSYLESFLHVCAWCRRIEVEKKWLTVEQHFAQRTGGKASHGICPECASKMSKEEGPA